VGTELNLLSSLPVTDHARDWQIRVGKDRPQNATISCEFGKDYFDGDRSTGYGGYRYDGRWKPVAQDIVEHYALMSGCEVLDVGCGKGFLVQDLRDEIEGLQVQGFDVSRYAIDSANETVAPHIYQADERALASYDNGSKDLIISINTLHNLPIDRLVWSLRRISEIARSAYIVVDSYRNDAERINLCDWQLTCRAFHDPDEWRWIFNLADYKGDYSFTVYP
jgi:SAM-dependent methyltransferase